MRSASPLRIVFSADPRWPRWITGLAVTSALTLTAWWLTHLLNRPTPLTVGVVSMLELAGLWNITRVWRHRHPAVGELRWDGLHWHFQSVGPDVEGPSKTEIAGELQVLLDLQSWMLLRFVPDPRSLETMPHASARHRTAWLPVSRETLTEQWHPLRCTVYSQRPEPPPFQ